jgi:transcription factor SFP1
MLPSHQGFSTPSQPGTPIGSGRPLSLQNNPTVSSVNTPTLMANPLQNSQFRNTPDSSGPGTPAEMDESMMGGFGDLSMQNNTMGQNQNQFARFNGNNNDMVDLCIDEPAKRLFSPSGGLGSPNAHFKLSGAQYGPNSDIARRIREQQLLAGVPDTTTILPNEEPKPFRCPVIGCEKAYKNQNGLKYHKAVSLTLNLINFDSSLTLISSSMVTTTSNFMTTPMAHSQSSTPKHLHHIQVPWAWRKKSHIAARCAASGIRT